MLPGLEMMVSCPNLAVPTEVMRHVVGVESGANPFAIGVVGGRLVRQPTNLDEAVATANMLETKGYNYSLGLAQVNRVNFSKYGLDTPAKAFDVCANLTAGSHILADCYRDAGSDWGKAFSCYYSGNFITGFVQGYVQKIYNSILSGIQTAASPSPTTAIPVLPASSAAPYAAALSAVQFGAIKPSTTPHKRLTATQRIAMRSVPIHTTAAPADAAVPTANRATHTPASTGATAAAVVPAGSAAMGSNPSTPVTVNATAASSIFQPQVHGPNDPPPAVNRGNIQHQEVRDSAFVF